jgi:2,3-bisphosphoglycerate-independent phosphoglycerate mutase
MKYIFILADGMADYPLEDLGEKTPLEAARTPHLDRLAREGAGGRVTTIPANLPPGSDVANLSLLGYSPAKFYTGRAPLEAASLGITLRADDIAFRCNLVTISEGKLVDYSAGHISSRESTVLIELLEEKLGGKGIKFYPGVSYRHILLIKEELLEEGRGRLRTVPPHDITGQEFLPFLPRGAGARFLKDLIQQSRLILDEQEINDIRIDLGENPASMIWLWGQGKAPRLPDFQEKFGLRGALISAVDLLKGIAITAGMDIIDVPGITGYFDTDYEAKGRHALRAAADHDFVYVHVEAPDEAGHAGNILEKIKAIEAIDEKIVGPVMRSAPELGDLRVVVAPDHATPVSLKTHTSDPVPWAVWGTGIEPDAARVYSEREARHGRFRQRSGYKLLPLLLKT